MRDERVVRCQERRLDAAFGDALQPEGGLQRGRAGAGDEDLEGR